jgi:RNA polymerase sigma-70 factor (ECF subfamily)
MFANSEINYRSDDETLVHHCLAGDENAFGFLVHKYKDLVHAYAYQKVSNYTDAEDITQEVFIRAYRNLAKLKYPHRFRSWLYAIASNECKRWLSKSLLRREKEVNWEEASEYDFGFEPSFAQTPTDWQIDLQEALQKLPEDNRIAVSMFYMSDCSLKEIGEYLGVSVNTVKGKLHRARQQLGNALSELYGHTLSKNKLKGGFIMQVMEQLQQLSRPTMPPPWQGHLLRQIPIALATVACLFIGILSFFSEEIHYTKMSEVSPFVLVDIRQPSAQIVETISLAKLPKPPSSPLEKGARGLSSMLAQATTDKKDESDTKKDAQALAEADALLAAKQYRQASDTYRLLIDSTSDDEIEFAAYYGLGMSLYKWDWTAGERTDNAINTLMIIPENSKQWIVAQLLLGRCFLRKGIWAEENEEKQENYETALKAFQNVLNAQTKDDLRQEAEYLQKFCQVERGEANPKTPAVRELLEMALQDEDTAIRFVAADALNIKIPGMRIVGTATDKLTGQPVAGALASIERMGKNTTNSQGHFSIDNISGRKGRADLWIDVKGYGKKMAQFMISETETDTQVDVQLGPGATVVGRVVDSDGRPIAGASVSISSPDGYRIRSVKTDAEGKYQFEGIEVRQDAYRLLVEHPDFIYSPATISVSQTGIVESTDIMLNRGVTLKGRVTDEVGNPIQDARVNASGGPTVIGGDTRTDANGEYHLKNIRSFYADATIVVDSPQFTPTYKRVRLDSGKELPPVDFALKPGKTLIGRVVDEQSNPIEGVRLQFQTWEPIEYRDFDRYAKTDANGEFRMEHLPDGKITLRLDKEGYLYMNNQPAEVEPDQLITTMKTPIVMQKGARAYGKVVDAETGKPIRRFKVKAEFPKQLEPSDILPDGLPGDWTSGFAFQSDTGEFETFERFRGMVIALQVEAEGYAPTYVPRVIFGAYDKEPLIIRMNKPKQRIEGIVVDAETSKPLAGAFVTIFDKNHPLFIFGAAPEQLATEPIQADMQGKFVLPGALSEEFYLYVTHPEHAPAIVGPVQADEKPQPIRVEMQKGCVVTGTAMPGLEITLRLLEYEPYLIMVNPQTRASNEGIYRFENLTPGKYHIVEMIPGEGFARTGRGMEFELQPGETKTISFLRTGGTRLYGKVTEADGTPIKNVAVDARGIPKDAKKPLSNEIRFEYSGTAVTDADGHYEIIGLPPGDYQLQAEIVTIPSPGEMKAAARAGKPPERPKPRKTTSAFTIKEEDKEVGLDVVFPEKE